MWLSCLLAFISSACTLVIELIAGRIMAPYVGVSLYTWTSIIGVVLAGISGGNFFGGYVADRHASRRALGVIFVLGSLASAFIPAVTPIAGVASHDLSFFQSIVALITLLFYLPMYVHGVELPLVV